MDLGRAAAKRAACRIHRRLVGDRVGGQLDLLHRLIKLANRGTRGVERHRPTADDHDPFSKIDAVAAVEVEEIVDRLDDPVLVGAFDVEVPSAHRADRQKEGLESFFPKVAETVVAGDSLVGEECDAELLDRRDLAVDDSPRQPVFGDPVAQHAAELGQGFEDGDLVAHQCQIVGTPETGGAAADDRHTSAPVATEVFSAELIHVPQTATPGVLRLGVSLRIGHQELEKIGSSRLGPELLGDEALEGSNGDRLIDPSPPAGVLAGR